MVAHAPTDLVPSLPEPYLDGLLLRDAQTYLQYRCPQQLPSPAEAHAWKWFYRTYSGLLRHWVLACHLPLDDVEDCLQDVWMVVMEKLPLFISDGTQGALCSWLRAIVHAKAVNARRYRARHALGRLDIRAEAHCLGREFGVTTEEERRACQRQVQQVLAALRSRVSPLTFEAFHQHWVLGHTIPDIAAQLNESRRKISCRLYKAKQKFRLLYQAFMPEP